MWNKGLALALLIVAAIAGYKLVTRQAETPLSEPTISSAAERIISMAPSLTEVIYALEQGPRVVGVTEYCRYPEDAARKPRIGGFHDINYEVIVASRPDLVVLLPSHQDARRHLAKLDLPTLTVDQTTVENIVKSVSTLGQVCGVPEQARALVQQMRNDIDHVRRQTQGRERARVLICVDRDRSSSSLSEVFIAGGDGFYANLLELAGGVNVYEDQVVKYPSLSREGIIRLNPDVIFELVPELDAKGWSETTLLRHWNSLSGVSAVDNGRIHVFTGDYVSVPGPRIIRFLRAIATALHPDAKFDSP